MAIRDQLPQLREGTDLTGMPVTSLAIPTLQAGGVEHVKPVLA